MKEVLKITENSGAEERLAVILEYLDNPSVRQPHHLSFERRLQDILGIMINKNTASILYITNKISVSTVREIESYGISNLSPTQYSIDKMIRSGILSSFREDSIDYDLFKKYWKVEHPHSPKTPFFFHISNAFRPVIEAYSEEIETKYIWPHSIHKSSLRKERYLQFKEKWIDTVKTEKERRESMIGTCIECSAMIEKASILGKDHHNYPVGFICSKCNRQATTQQMLQWTQTQK